MVTLFNSWTLNRLGEDWLRFTSLTTGLAKIQNHLKKKRGAVLTQY